MQIGFGDQCRRWRRHRGISQMQLALRAEVSQRHLSFVESGRSAPSRELVFRLGRALDLGLRARNELLLAAGHAPAYAERALDDEGMEVVNAALERMLDHHLPYPAMVLDGGWNVLRRNAMSQHIMGRCIDERAIRARDPHRELNFLRLFVAADGLRPHVRSWERSAPALLRRLHREVAAQPGSPLAGLLAEMGPQIGDPGTDDDSGAREAVIPLELEVDGHRLRLFNLISTFGAPQDVVVQELRVETAFPADAATGKLLVAWARMLDLPGGPHRSAGNGHRIRGGGRPPRD